MAERPRERNTTHWAVSIETSWLSKIKARKLFATFENGFGLVDFIDQNLILYDDDSARDIPVTKAEPLKEEIAEFVKCARNGIEPHIGGEASIHALGVALAAVVGIAVDLDRPRCSRQRVAAISTSM